MTYRIKGILKLPDGAPAANCEVEFVSRKNFSPLVQGAKTNILTSATGAYDVTIELGEYAVIVYTGGTYPAQAGTITLSADTTPGLDLPSLLNRSDWVPATPEYMQQIEAWLVSAGEYAASAEASAQSAAESAASTTGAISAHEAKAGAHSIGGISGLQQALDGKEAAGAAASAISTHKTESDAHAIETITGLRGELDSIDVALRNDLSEMDGANLVGGATYAQIAAYSGSGTRIHCLGRNLFFDGGHGYFYRDDADVTSAPVAGLIIVDALGRRWKREYTHLVSRFWDDIQTAVNTVSSIGGGELICPDGFSIDSTPIVVPELVFLLGNDRITEIVGSMSMPVINVTYGLNQPDSIALQLNGSSGMRGFCVNYPNQIARDAATAPIVYGWAIGGDQSITHNIDNVELNNIFLRNAYLGIKADKFGRFKFDNIYGQPFAKGIFIDRVYDMARMTNIHFWPFYSALGTVSGNWVRDNGRALEIHRVDGLDAQGVLVLGYKDGIFCGDIGNGSAWASFTGCNFDGCINPIITQFAQNIQFIGGSATCLTADRPIFQTYDDPVGGTVTFSSGFKFYGPSNIAAVIRSPSGVFVFEALFPEVSKNGVHGVAVVNESTAEVHVNGGALGKQAVRGGASTVINGVPLPSASNQVAPTANPNLPSSWAGDMPVSSADGGVMFTITSSVAHSDYALTAPLNTIPGIYVLEMDMESPAKSGCYLRIHFASSSGAESFAEVWASDVGHQNYDPSLNNGRSSTHVVFPLYLGAYIDTAVIRVEAHTYAAGVTTSLTLKNIKIHNPDTKVMLDSTASLVQGNLFAQPVFSTGAKRNKFTSMTLNNTRGFPSYDDMPMGNKVFLGAEAPTWVAEMGDTVINNRPAVGQPRGWVHTSAGAWRSIGSL